MQSLMRPGSIVVVGGGNDVRKPGGKVVQNLAKHGFAKLWVVNPKSDGVQDLPTFATIEELPEPPELAIVAVPAPHVPGAVQSLIDRGTRAFIVLSAGFSETDAAGRKLEQQLIDMVERAGARLVGPNSLGVFTPAYFGVFGGPEQQSVPGTIDLLSASGSTAAFIMEAGLDRGLRFASTVSVGNSACLGVEDFLGVLDDDPGPNPARTCLLYLESIDEPHRILEHARSLHAQGRRVVALKAGTTEVGARAASSHTGAMATSDAAVGALFDKAGIVRVSSKSDMVDAAGVLAWSRPPKSDDIVIITQAGGPGIMLADALSSHGFRVPELPEELQRELLAGLLPGSSARNPIDFLAAAGPDHVRHVFRVLAEKAADRVGAACFIFGSPGLFDIGPALDVLLEATRTMPFPVYPVLPSTRTAAEEAARFRAAGGFYFTDEVALGRALGVIRRTPPPAPARPELPAIDSGSIRRAIDEAKAQGRTHLSPEQVGRVLEAIGLRLPGQAVVRDVSDAERAARQLGCPVVMKVVGPVHKTDVQGVAVGVRNEGEVRETFARLMGMSGAEGVLVQQQAQGLELITGFSREERFGALVLFGLGGIFTEAMRDVRMGLAPLGRDQARRMVEGIKGSKLLAGVRGRAGVDAEALADAVVRISALAHAFPELREMDVNPLMGQGRDLLAVDARIAIR